MTDRFTGWLHRRGIIRTVSSTYHSGGDPIVLRLEAWHRIPGSVVVWFGRRHMLERSPDAARTHRLAALDRGGATLSDRRQWRLTYRPAPTAVLIQRDRRPLDRGRSV